MTRSAMLVGASVVAAAAVLAAGSTPAGAATRRPTITPHLAAADMGALEAVTHASSAVRMASSSAGGISVRVPASFTVYNDGKAHVVPTVHVDSGANKSLGAKQIIVYAGGHKVASGSGVRLKAGSYTESVAVRYRAFKYVIHHRTVTTKTWHPSGSPEDTACQVTAIDDTGTDGSTPGDGYGDPTGASCTSAAYLHQAVALNASQISGIDWYDDDGDPVVDLSQLRVGNTLYTDDIPFSGYYTTTTKTVTSRTKTWTGRHTYRTPRRGLTVKNGGYDKIFSGGDTVGGEYDFTTTASSDWVYDIECDDVAYFGVNWSTADNYGDFGPEEATAYGETSQVFRVSGYGSVTLNVFSSECSWAIGIFSKQKVH